jgi:predicted nucleic acid-binding Zn ribbon protein
MPDTYCIICGKKKPGIPVKNDYVLDAIRWFKTNVTKNAQNNKLVVCKEDYSVYKKNRDRYVSRQIIYLVIGILFTILGLFLTFSISTLLVGLGIVAFLYLMSLLNYTPKLNIDANNGARTKHNQ